MKKCLVLGGGFAGLSSAVFLSEKKIPVHLIESSPKLGGRSYSIFNEKFADSFDNGQHILMGCYYNTINFLKLICSYELLDFQKSLCVNFVEEDGIINKLKSPKHFYPFNLLLAILNYKSLSIKERLKIVDFFLDLICCFEEDISDKNAAEWLKEKGQSEKSIKAFWEIIIVGTLNTSPEKASACMFANVLKRIFFDGPGAASIVIPKVGLSELFVRQSENYLKEKSGSISLSERILEFVVEDGKIKKIISDKQEYIDFDYVISAIPAYALEKIKVTCNNSNDEKKLNQFLDGIRNLEYSSILNVHLWLSENPFKQKFYGLISSEIHWLFNHDKHISLTTSNADKYNDKNNDEILPKFCSELEKYFPIFKRKLVVDSKIIKEKRATFIPDTKSIDARKNVYSPFKNLFLAGDWVNTGLPSTIESAVQSGKTAAEKLLFEALNGDTY